MILDPIGLAAGGAESTVGSAVEAVDDAASADGSGETTAMLMFISGHGAPRAVPLALVARLEEIDRKDIEIADGKPVVQYRGQLMPLVLSHDDQTTEGEGKVAIVVFSEDGRSMGLVVDEIVDIVDDVLNIEINADQPGIAGSAIIDGKATDIIDTGYYLTQAYPDWFKTTNVLTKAGSARKRMLLVDDSPFFRNLMAPLFSVAGYDVTSVESVEDALELRESGVEFDVIISDIEMPGKNGFEFAEDVRADERWSATPMVALSAHASDADKQKGRDVGFDGHVAKFDRDILLETVSDTLNQHLSALSENAA